jgi:hypothetical protein
MAVTLHTARCSHPSSPYNPCAAGAPVHTRQVALSRTEKTAYVKLPMEAGNKDTLRQLRQIRLYSRNEP